MGNQITFGDAVMKGFIFMIAGLILADWSNG